MRTFPYNKGDLIEVYKDYQHTKLLGMATLKEKVDDGHPFILADGNTEKDQITYNYELWKVDWKWITLEEAENSLIQFRKPAKIWYWYTGNTTSNIDDPVDVTYALQDKFLEIDGKQIY